MLKERGAEKTGYRGCLMGALVGGIIGAAIVVYWSLQYTRVSTPALPSTLLPVLFGFIGFVVGAVLGSLMVFLVDLVIRKREIEEDEF